MRSKRKQNRRRGPRAWRRAVAAVARGTAVAFLAFVGVAAGLRIRTWVFDHPYFALREIRVAVDGRMEPAQVVAWAGIAEGMSTWRLEEQTVTERLLAEPRVRRAQVIRLLPRQVRLSIEERRAVGVVLAGEPRFFDADGVVWAPIAGEAVAGYPCLTGLRGRDLEDRTGWTAERLRRAGNIIRRWQEHADWPRLSELRPQGAGLVAFLDGSPLAVRFSAAADDAELEHLGAVLALWRGREAELAAIDLSLPDQAIARLRRAGKSRAT